MSDSFVLEGSVVADSLNKTVKVRVISTVLHPRYRKVMRLSKCYLVHDESGSLKSGQKVKIRSSRPISGRKKWIVV